ncbi:MAG TPA: sugar phosphate isomerase/epimerase [Propionibacteriaceae bacterium]|nr:sugar phosphate isomerase/epimerase [Propionibacteriaceae bacterium]
MPGRLSVNPIAYWMTGGKTTATLGAAFRELGDIGFTRVKADVPTDMPDPADYLPWLESFGMGPALSLFSSGWDDAAQHEELARQAGRYAAVQASFGMTTCMLSSFAAGSARFAEPAVGADADAGRLATVVEGMGRAAEAMRAEGVKAALHPHVAGWVEVEDEIRAVLDQLGPDLIAFAPDTGHMYWAGMDVPAVLADYADRLVAVHLKDVFRSGVEAARREGLDYKTASLPGRVWAEPGIGDADLAACVAAFPADFDGDWMIEIDVPSMPNDQAHRIAYDWARSALPLGS